MKTNHTKSIAVIANCSEDRAHLQKLLQTYSRKSGGSVLFIGWDRLSNKKERSEEATGITYKYLQRGWGSANKKLLLGLPLWMMRVFFYTFTLDVDVIHVLDFDSAIPVAFATRIRKIPIIYDIRDNFALRHNWPNWTKWLIEALDRWLISKSDYVIVVDESRIEEQWQPWREKFIVLYNVPPDIPKPAQKTNVFHPFTVYTSGYLSEIRGITLLLKAAERIPGMRILMAGRFVNKELEKIFLQHPQVDFRGWLKQKDALSLCYESDVIFAFYDPKTEINRKAASNKWFDAMMAGKPVLVNEEVHKSTWIEIMNIGYTCPFGDTDALVSILEEIKNNPEKAQQKGNQGRELFEKKYNWPLMEKKLDRIITELIKAKGGNPTDESNNILT